MIRLLVRLFAVGVIAAIALVILAYGELLVFPGSKGSDDMAPTIPACNGRVFAQGFTYTFGDPEPGDVVAIHAARNPDGSIVPDEDSDDLTLILRVAAGPKDVIEGRDGSVFVNRVKFDNILTEPFKPVQLYGDQYFVLGDNRSAAVDSREFGPILGGSMFARALLVIWPLKDFGLLPDRPHVEAETDETRPALVPPPGKIDCD
jgi:signal peptidase I